MNILGLLAENFARGPVTVRFPERPPAPEGYRGLVRFEPQVCTGCATCAFVCTSAAIRFRSKRDTYDWSYDAGQCTFCGRCADVCESHAITMEAAPPPVYTAGGALKCAHTLARKKPGGAK